MKKCERCEKQTETQWYTKYGNTDYWRICPDCHQELFTIEKMKYSEKSIREKISKEYELRLSDLQNELNKFHKIFKNIYIKIT